MHAALYHRFIQGLKCYLSFIIGTVKIRQGLTMLEFIFFCSAFFFHSLNTIHFCYNISFLFSFFSYKCDVKEQTKTNGKFFAFISFSKWILTAHFCSNVSQQAKNGQQDWRTCTIYFRRQDIFYILGICMVILSKKTKIKNKHSRNVSTAQHCISNVCSFVFYLFNKQLSCTIYYCI